MPNGTVYHYLLDGQGDVVRLVDSSGNVVATYHYCPTGNAAVPDSGPAAGGNPYRQGGDYYEPGTQTYVQPDGTRRDANSDNATQRYAALVEPGGGGSGTTARQRLVSILRVLANRAEYGFEPFSTPLIIDVNVDSEIHCLTPILQLIGYNALSVAELFGGNTRTKDAEILNVARQVQGLVVTYDKGKDLGGGFAGQELRLNPRLPKTIESAIRQIDAIVPPPLF